MKTRYLPPGTLTRCRMKWLALGVVLGAGLMAGARMYANALLPPELPPRPLAATVVPEQTGEPMAGLARADLGPCLPGKDCVVFDDPRTPTNTTPEPGAMALVGLGLGAMAITRRRS